MKIHIWSEGDPSVGIPGCTATVEIDNMENWGTGGQAETEFIRDCTRDALKSAFMNIFDDGRVTVMYEDELQDKIEVLDEGHDGELKACSGKLEVP